MQLLNALGHYNPLGILPWPFADAIARIHPCVTARCRGAQVCFPTGLGGPRRLGERRAMRIGSLEATEVGAIALANARDEERHRGLLSMHCSGQTDGPQSGERQHLNRHFPRNNILYVSSS